MTLTQEQVKEIKRQVFEQIKDFPEERRAQIKEQIDSMNPEQLELFVKERMSQQGTKTEKGIFRMIVDGEIEAKKIDENKEAIAVVSKKAVSRGHVLIIPKRIVRKINAMPKRIFNLANKIVKKIVSKLNAPSVEIQTEYAFGEIIINVMPVYDKVVDVKSERYDVSEKELEEVYQKLKVVKKIGSIKIGKKKETQGEVLKLKRRIP